MKNIPYFILNFDTPGHSSLRNCLPLSNLTRKSLVSIFSKMKNNTFLTKLWHLGHFSQEPDNLQKS